MFIPTCPCLALPCLLRGVSSCKHAMRGDYFPVTIYSSLSLENALKFFLDVLSELFGEGWRREIGRNS